MNVVAVIVISALVNLLMTGLVGGVIVYRFQRDIDASYNKQMEEFKVNLQKISFEQQTKFVRSHEKAVETLDNLFKKHVDFEKSIRKALEIDLNLFGSPYNQSGTEQQLLELSNIFTNSRDYFHANSLYLSKEMNDFFTRVFFVNKTLYEYVEIILMMPSKNKQVV